MEIGDYVRINPESSERCGIDKLIRIENRYNYNNYYFEKYRGVISNPEHFIAKSSPNIIDLIEVGDILTIRDMLGNTTKVEVDENFKLLSGKIVSIVTHEQFESIKYEVIKSEKRIYN